jgi:ADP-ribose pyrophosphatase YjhB (NUDIX family)
MKAYISELRSLVGSRPLVLAGAAVIIEGPAQDSVLLLKRADSGKWTIPGGFTEPGESTEDTARRETREETGVELGELRLLGVYSGSKFFHRYPNGDQVHNVTVLYGASGFSGELSADGDEVTEARFFPKASLPQRVAAPVAPILAELFSAAAPR